MIPGRVQQLRLKTGEPGRHRGQCAEFCGEQHAQMALEVVVVPPAQFDAWLRAQAAPAVAPQGAAAARGLALFRSEGCVACHSIRGLAEGGASGPDLTHVGSRRLIGAGSRRRRRGRIRPLDRRGAASEARCAHAGVRPARSRGARRARGLHGRAAMSEPPLGSGAPAPQGASSRLPSTLPRPAGELEALRARLGTASGLAAAQGGEQHAHRRLLHRHRAALLRARRRPRAADAGAARAARRHAARRPGLQPGLHHARHGDDVPVRRAGGRGDRRLPAARHARRPRPAVPAPLGLRLLGLRGRRAGVLLHDLLRRRARRRLVHVSAARRARSTRPAPAPTGGCSASASSRSRRSPARSS